MLPSYYLHISLVVVVGDDDDENMRCFAYIYARVIYLFPKPYISAACFILKVLKVQFTSSGEISGTKKKTTYELSYFLRSAAGRSQKGRSNSKKLCKTYIGREGIFPQIWRCSQIQAGRPHTRLRCHPSFTP